VTVTASLYDATPIATPSSLPTVPTGSWALPFGVPQEQQKGCLTDSGQIDAWDWNIIGPPIQFNVQAISEMTQGAVTIALESIDTSMNVTYGMQPPIMTAQKIILVSGLDEPSRGPAWHFQALYDKIVLIGTDKSAAASSIPEAQAELARRDASAS